MALRGAALLEGLVQGVEEMAISLQPEQNGLVIIVTHAPSIDALYALQADKIDMIKIKKRVAFMGDKRVVKDGYTIYLTSPIEAHNMGQYMRGQLETPDLGRVSKRSRSAPQLRRQGSQQS